MPELPNFLQNLNSFPPSIDWLVLAFALFMVGVFALYSLFLVYHALRYGEGVVVRFVGLAVYFGISLLLISSMLSAALLLT